MFKFAVTTIFIMISQLFVNLDGFMFPFCAVWIASLLKSSRWKKFWIILALLLEESFFYSISAKLFFLFESRKLKIFLIFGKLVEIDISSVQGFHLFILLVCFSQIPGLHLNRIIGIHQQRNLEINTGFVSGHFCYWIMVVKAQSWIELNWICNCKHLYNWYICVILLFNKALNSLCCVHLSYFVIENILFYLFCEYDALKSLWCFLLSMLFLKWYSSFFSETLE